MDQQPLSEAIDPVVETEAKLPQKWRVLSVFVLIFSSFSCLRFLNTAISLIFVALSFRFYGLDFFLVGVILSIASFYITILGSLPFAVADLVIAQKAKKAAKEAGVSSKLISSASVLSIVGLVLVCIHSVVIVTALGIIY